MRRFPGSLLSYWYILIRIIHILWLRGSHISYLDTGTSSPVWGDTAFSSPRYMVSDSGQTCYCFSILLDWKLILEVYNSGRCFLLTHASFDTWQWVQIMHWLKWVIIPLFFIRPNIYSILGSKSVEGILDCCTRPPNRISLVHFHFMIIHDRVYSI